MLSVLTVLCFLFASWRLPYGAGTAIGADCCAAAIAPGPVLAPAFRAAAAREKAAAQNRRAAFEARRYVKNMLKKNSLAQLAQRENDPALRDISTPFYAQFAEICFASGQPCSYTSLCEKDKQLFQDMWEKETALLIAKKCKENISLLSELCRYNNAFDEAILAFSYTLPEQHALDALFETCYASRSIVAHYASNDETHGSVAVRREAFKKSYSAGLALVKLGGTGVAPFLPDLAGHCSIITEPAWKDTFALDTHQHVCTAAWSDDPSDIPPWPDSGYGVQWEPLTYWLHTSGAIYILMPGRSVWVWDWFKSHWEWRGDAPVEDRMAAAAYAKAQTGKEYNWEFLDRWRTDKFYCTSLVWRAWKNQGYNIAFPQMIHPVDVVLNPNTRLLYGEPLL